MARRHTSESGPQILQVTPAAAIPGGEFFIHGKSFTSGDSRAKARFGDMDAPIVVGSENFLVARVPDSASVGELVITNGETQSPTWLCEVGIQIADSLHPVASPAVDKQGNVFATFSGSRGQKTAVAVFKIDASYNARPFVTDLMNATGLAFDAEGMLYISSRQDGTVYQATPNGSLSVYVEGMGVATGLAFDSEENLYVGDRSGTVFKISRQRQIYVFATLEPSIAAYHLAFGAEGYLYVTGPTTSSFDGVYRISPAGEVELFYRGVGRPQGLAFDAEENLYLAGSIGGRRGIVRITPDRNADLFLSGPNIVGLAFTPSRAMMVATSNSVYRVDVNIAGRPLSGS